MKTPFFLLVVFSSHFALAADDIQKRVDLDDVEIKGEAQNRGMSVLNRTKNNLESRVPLRKDYRVEIIDELPEGFSSTKNKDE